MNDDKSRVLKSEARQTRAGPNKREQELPQPEARPVFGETVAHRVGVEAVARALDQPA